MREATASECDEEEGESVVISEDGTDGTISSALEAPLATAAVTEHVTSAANNADFTRKLI